MWYEREIITIIDQGVQLIQFSEFLRNPSLCRSYSEPDFLYITRHFAAAPFYLAVSDCSLKAPCLFL